MRFMKPVEVHLFIVQRIQRLAAAFRYLLGECDHLIDGLLAGKPPDEIFHHFAQFVFRFSGPELEQNFDHHGDHHVHPAGADEGKRAVEIENTNAGMFRGDACAKGFNHRRYFPTLRIAPTLR